MELTQTLIGMLDSYAILISFVAGGLTEEFLIVLAVLSGTEIVPFWIVFVFGFLGIAVHDGICYFIGRSRLIYYMKEKFKIAKRHRKLELFIERIGRKTVFLPLLYSKFIYGIRVAIIFYASHKENSFKKFMIYNSIASFVWLSIMLPLAWLAGRGFTELIHVAKGVEKILAIIVIGGLIFYLGNKFIISALLKTLKMKKNKK